MSDFSITSDLVKKIIHQCNVSADKVESLCQFYKTFSEDMKSQYLAHVIRTMEERLRKISGNEMFRIVCSPVDASAKELGIAGAHYYAKRYFAIFYHPKTDEKQLRVMLAHELGHLFLVEWANAMWGADYDEKTIIEPVSTLFGILIILDKNEFYHNKTTTFKHSSPEEVLRDFSLLRNRDSGKLNIS